MAFKLIVAAALLAVVAAQHAPNYVDADYADYPEPQHQQRAPQVARAIGRPLAPPAPKPTPVAILKQINKHNDDGSYTYGFEGADGTFKIETKYANGDVKGKYGFVDDTGKVRTVEYGADRYGFQPAGEGITVAPPTLVDETLTEEPELLEQRPRARPQQQRPRPAPRPQYQPEEQYRQAPQQQAPQQYVPQQQAPQQRAPQAPIQGANYEQQINYQAAPQQYQVQEPQEPPRRQAPRPVPQRPISVPGASPVPQRALSIPGASPVPARPAQIPGSFIAEPPRVRTQQQQAPRAGPVPRAPAPQQQFYQPQPQQYQPQPQQYQPAPVPQPRPQAPRAFQAPRQSQSSMLDQLERDYALPQGGVALHDITFGSTY